jgi:hypothetical protein
MKFSWSALASFAKSNPSLAVAIVAPIASAVVKDPTAVSDAVGLARGGSIGAYIDKHPDIVTNLATAVAGAIEKNPQLIAEALAAFSAPAAAAVPGA